MSIVLTLHITERCVPCGVESRLNWEPSITYIRWIVNRWFWENRIVQNKFSFNNDRIVFLAEYFNDLRCTYCGKSGAKNCFRVFSWHHSHSHIGTFMAFLSVDVCQAFYSENTMKILCRYIALTQYTWYFQSWIFKVFCKPLQNFSS